MARAGSARQEGADQAISCRSVRRAGRVADQGRPAPVPPVTAGLGSARDTVGVRAGRKPWRGRGPSRSVGSTRYRLTLGCGTYLVHLIAVQLRAP